MATIRTVRGDVPAHTLGRTDYHEHLLMRSPLLRGDELTDIECSRAEATALRDAGIDALCELTPIGVGRDPRGLAAIANATGLHIVLATGLHREAQYPPEHWAHRVDEELLVDLFVRDLLEGCDGNDYGGPLPDPTSVRAGVIKVGAGYWSISELEQRTFAAAGEAHRLTGAPVVAHLEQGTAGVQVLETLERAGVPAQRVCLAHCDRNPDPGLHAELIESGATVGYDGMGRTKYWPDSVLLSCLEQALARVSEPRVVLGGDVARRTSFTAHGGLPGMAYLPTTFIPRLSALLGADLVRALLVDNAARLLTLAPQR